MKNPKKSYTPNYCTLENTDCDKKLKKRLEKLNIDTLQLRRSSSAQLGHEGTTEHLNRLIMVYNLI